MKNKKKITKIEYIILYFTIYSIIGWLIETAYAYHVYGHFVKRGFLFGPICPIYGCGGIILINFLKKYKKDSIKLFFMSSIVFSIFEYIAGYVLDALFSARWWDYTDEFFNLNGRISLFFSIVWGIFGILFINHIHPLIEKTTKKIIKKIPNKIRKIAINLLFIAILTDSILSSLKYLEILHFTNG